jgi:hypothetical protein
MSAAIDGREGVPDAVTVPDGMGALVFEGDRPAHATYEPFAPSANYHTVSVDRTVEADGTYLLAVYDPADRTGPVGVTVGYEESFTPTEYLRVPLDLVRVHLWEGQSPLVVAGPWFLVLAAGAARVRSRRRDDRERPLARYALSAGALLVLATAAGTLVQMAVALTETGLTAGALVTALFVAVPAASGAWALRFALSDAPALTPRTRTGLLVAGAASLATWAGFVVGPAVLLAAGLAPASLVGPSRGDTG